MTHVIHSEEQLDFDDVMIVPKPSTVESRKERTSRTNWRNKIEISISESIV